MADALGHDVIGTFPGVLLGEHHHPPALGGHHGIVTLVVGIGTAGTETGQSRIDQLGMTVTEAIIVDAQPPGDAGPEVLDDNIGKLRQPLGFVQAFRGLQVEDDAFLAAVPLDGTRRIAEFFSARRLDLDDFGPEVGHHHGGDAASPAAGEVEDGDSIKDLCHGAPFLPGSL